MRSNLKIMGISNIQSYRSDLDVTGKHSTSSARCQSLAQKPANAALSEAADVLSLSAESQTAADALKSSLDLPPLEDLFVSEDKLQELKSSLQERIRNLLTAHGIDDSNPLDLQIAGDGHVVVSNDHPQKEQIEQLLRENPDIRDDFAKYSAQSSLFDAAQEAIAFQKEYARDPVGAVQRFSYLFDATAKPPVTLGVWDSPTQ
jgi:hypothetical protein